MFAYLNPATGLDPRPHTRSADVATMISAETPPSNSDFHLDLDRRRPPPAYAPR
jgi:hypothetical protein